MSVWAKVLQIEVGPLWLRRGLQVKLCRKSSHFEIRARRIERSFSRLVPEVSLLERAGLILR